MAASEQLLPKEVRRALEMAQSADQFVLHAKALRGNPYDGHTLGLVVAEMEELTEEEARRTLVDKSYRGRNHSYEVSVWISGQVLSPRRSPRGRPRQRRTGRRRLQLLTCPPELVIRPESSVA